MSIAQGPAPAGNVLIVGANPKVLSALSAELQQRGFAVESCADYENTSWIKETYSQAKFDVVAFGRALTEESKRDLENHFRTLNSAVAFVNGLAPVIPLLADQVELARNLQPRGVLIKRSDKVHVSIVFKDIRDDEISVTFYHLNWMYKSIEMTLYKGHEKHPLYLELPKKSGQLFLVVRADGKVVAAEKIDELLKRGPMP